LDPEIIRNSNGSELYTDEEAIQDWENDELETGGDALHVVVS